MIMVSGDAIRDLRIWATDAKEALRPLPSSLYLSEALLELEIEKLFYQEWVCAGHVSELREPGDYLTFDIVDKPVLVTTGPAGEIRAFSNVCVHRGSLLAAGCGNQSTFTCPYHSWSYGLDGGLKGAP